MLLAVVDPVPQSDTVIVALAAIAAIGVAINVIVSAVVVIATQRNAAEVQRTRETVVAAVNGQKHELVREVRMAARAVGVAAGAAGEQPEAADAERVLRTRSEDAL